MIPYLKHAITHERHTHMNLSAWRVRQPLARCPTVHTQPQGLLFTHVSKTGGSSVRSLLQRYAQRVGLPFIELNRGQANDHLPLAAGSKRSVVFIGDGSDLTLTDDDRRRFFVLGSVRPPCDWELSTWAYESSWADPQLVNALQRMGNAGTAPYSKFSGAAARYFSDVRAFVHKVSATEDSRLLGRTPPFDNEDDRRRFSSWIRSPRLQMISARQQERQNESLEWGMVRRFLGPNGNATSLMGGAHCWMRLHSLTTDLTECLRRYITCGGDQIDLAAWLRETQSTHANPSSHLNCQSFFNAGDATLVAARNEFLLDPRVGFGGHCCSLS